MDGTGRVTVGILLMSFGESQETHEEASSDQGHESQIPHCVQHITPICPNILDILKFRIRLIPGPFLTIFKNCRKI